MDSIINLVMTYVFFLVAAGSPGPATLAIMATSATMGRKAGVLFALGVVNGSIIWGMLAAFGLLAILSQFAWAFMVLKFAGGAYLLWMASKALRVALTPDAKPRPPETRHKYLYLQGMALHLTNPKALLSWSAIIAFGVPKDAPAGYLIALLIGCAVMASLLFIGYAMLFSTPRMMAGYQRLRRKINGILAAVFGLAGIKLLTSNV
ncbi:MAG: LysE family translocator [Rhodobacteraceae bacterium]|nr:LysE family translocator [Paracoccaceae bacterium]